MHPNNYCVTKEATSMGHSGECNNDNTGIQQSARTMLLVPRILILCIFYFHCLSSNRDNNRARVHHYDNDNNDNGNNNNNNNNNNNKNNNKSDNDNNKSKSKSDNSIDFFVLLNALKRKNGELFVHSCYRKVFYCSLSLANCRLRSRQIPRACLQDTKNSTWRKLYYSNDN